MRTRRLLLAASALSTLTFGCSKTPEKPRDDDTTQPLPGNPKGTFYDDAMVAPVVSDAEIRPLPGNPKGTLYDAGGPMKPSPDAQRPPRDAASPTDALPRDAASPDAASPTDAAVPRDAAPSPRDAAIPPRDAAIRRTPQDGPPLKGNPKGSLYDKGQDPGL